MIIGVDFDNTIVCYDDVFPRAAVEIGLVNNVHAFNKTNLRDHLRRIGKEDSWTELQGLVYGDYIKYAQAFAGVKDFFSYCKKKGIAAYIISHKTRFPYAACRYDLHEAANKWLQINGFNDSFIGLNNKNVYFELSKEKKLERIRQLKCTHFIDDLPEFLEDPMFSGEIDKILFDPHNIYERNRIFQHLGSWDGILSYINDSL